VAYLCHLGVALVLNSTVKAQDLIREIQVRSSIPHIGQRGTFIGVGKMRGRGWRYIVADEEQLVDGNRTSPASTFIGTSPYWTTIQ
jgi:hypothetical protein